MLVRDVMTSPALTVRADAPLKEATGLLDARSITTLPVVDSRGRPVGVVSEADLISGMVPARHPAAHDPVRHGGAQPPARAPSAR